MVRFFEIFLNVDFDSSKEVSWCTERNAKNTKSLLSIFTEKMKKNHQNVPITGILGGNLHFWRFFLIFSLTVLSKDLRFFALHSVPQDASFELSKSTFRKNFRFFTIKGDPFDLGGVK